ncbi:MAG: HEPN domain-containing protein [Desulfuromonadales bacterium]|nr:HEPN domain-containing protein [Desulfuromonadales bacterium]
MEDKLWKCELWQWKFIIKGLIPEQVKLKEKIWLKKGELFLEKKGNDLQAYLLGKEEDRFNRDEILADYLRFTCLISTNTPDIKDRGGVGLKSENEFGKDLDHQNVTFSSIAVKMPDEVIPDIERHVPKFIDTIKNIHDKYNEVVSGNEFMEVALDYFYDAEKKFIYSNEGFISAMISMEALFNEGPSDIRYKLSHRAAFLLGFCDMDSIQVFEKLKEIYNKRSNLVHGRGDLKNDPDRGLVSRYTRRSIIIFLILLSSEKRNKISKKKRKEELLLEIDNAMLDNNACNLLKKEIEKGLKDFQLPVPRVFEGEGNHGHYRVTAW